jgi:hypothetical protein
MRRVFLNLQLTELSMGKKDILKTAKLLKTEIAPET